jgi:hypothetical protein
MTLISSASCVKPSLTPPKHADVDAGDVSKAERPSEQTPTRRAVGLTSDECEPIDGTTIALGIRAREKQRRLYSVVQHRVAREPLGALLILSSCVVACCALRSWRCLVKFVELDVEKYSDTLNYGVPRSELQRAPAARIP